MYHNKSVRWSIPFWYCLCVWAGPEEFGRAEIDRALAARGLKPGQVRFVTDVSAEDRPESYRILPGSISGGDLRGLMYGMFEAADQIRQYGRLIQARGEPATPIRGIRYFVHNADLEKSWYFSHEYWTAFFQMLARNRFNRFNLVFAHQTEYLAPPYPFWVTVDEFPEVKARGVSVAERERNLDMLRFISQTAAEYAIDFTLGIWEHNIQAGMTPSVDGLTSENIGPYSYAALKKVLARCPAVRSVQMRTNSESGIPSERQVDFYSKWIYRALSEGGRRVVLDLRGWAMQPEMLKAATGAGVPVRLSSKYWAEDLGRPYQPAETFPGYSYLNFLDKPRAYDFYWELWGLGSNRLLLWGDPDYVRRAVPTFALSGSSGFEIDPPLAQKGFGNRPGEWSVFAPDQKNRIFWRHEFERYWLFYLLWGRLSYDPKTSDRVWKAELERRFGPAAGDVLEAYKQSSRVLPEIVATHLADPNMYVWPEINPGGLIDAYKEVRPSDWRFVATIAEGVENRLEGIASAKQTAAQTAARLRELSAKVEDAIASIRKKLREQTAEWRSSESDFLVLAHLARYHAQKQIAADQLTWFYRTGDVDGLHSARRELRDAVGTWESLVKLTDRVYPEQMAFGPHDIGHWKDKLPWVRHDVEVVEERARIWEQFGRFQYGFDFGARVSEPRDVLYRRDPYLWSYSVEPRFKSVDPETSYTEATGFGWATAGEREAIPLPAVAYRDLRATLRTPGQLPRNALFGDAIRGRGPQTFRVKTGAGTFQVSMLRPDGSADSQPLAAQNGVLDIVMKEGEWTVSGLVIRGKEQPAPKASVPQALPRPQIDHTPPKGVIAGQPLELTLRISPIKGVTHVRLHYRAVNQLSKFVTLDSPISKPSFVIRGEDISSRWDLMYYFEILNAGKGGWFEPDPGVATPYFVVKVEPQPAR